MQPEDKNIYVKNRQVKFTSIALFLELPSEFLPFCHDAVLRSLSTSALTRISQFPGLLFLISAFCQSSQDLKICINGKNSSVFDQR